MKKITLIFACLRRKRSGNSLEIIVAIFLGHSSMVVAQSGTFTPEISISRVYDSNVFFDETEEEDDLITRVTPALSVSRSSPTFEWQGRYSFDAEEYKEHEDLSDSMNRQSAELSMLYTPDQVLEFSTELDFTETYTPGELNTLTGFEPGRVKASLARVSPAMNYRFSPVYLGTLEYSLSKYKIKDGAAEGENIRGDTHNTRIALTQSLGPRDELTYGYIYRRYQFEPSFVAAEVDSHTPTLAWNRQLSPESEMTLEAGSRISDDSTEPYFQANLTRQFTSGSIDFTYLRDESALVGQLERFETETVNLILSRRFGNNLEINITPGYGKITGFNNKADVTRVGLNLDYAFNDAFSFIMNYQYYDFEGQGFGLDADRQVNRNVILMGVQLRYPGGRQ